MIQPATVDTPVMVGDRLVPMGMTSMLGLGKGGGGGGHHHGGGGFIFSGGPWGYWGPDVLVAQAGPPPCPMGQMSVWNDSIQQYNCVPAPGGMEGLSDTIEMMTGNLLIPAAVGAALGVFYASNSGRNKSSAALHGAMWGLAAGLALKFTSGLK